MPSDPAVVLDTNVLFSALLDARSRFADTILNAPHRYVVTESVLVELFRHKERIVRASRLEEAEVVELLYYLLRRAEVFREELIRPAYRATARAWCADVDPADAPLVALTLEVDGALWTGDRKLREGLRRQGFDRFFEPDPG